MTRFRKDSIEECEAIFSQANTTDIEKWMLVFRIVSSNSTETQTESSKAATYRTSRYNNNEVLSKNTVWWPVIDKDIEDCSKVCTSCATAAQDPTGVPLCQWKLPLHPLQRVHIDYAVPFKGKMWLLLIDTFVKWPEIHEMKPTTTEATISKLKHIFTAQGLPEQIIFIMVHSLQLLNFSNFATVM